MMNNEVFISAAGSGKTTFLINKALDLWDQNVLITTYTIENSIEIKKKLFEIEKARNKVGSNLKIQTWVSFLLNNGVRPYRNKLFKELDGRNVGYCLHNGRSAKFIEKSKLGYFFNNDLQVYPDKISEFVCTCDNKCGGLIIDRLSSIFKYIFIDECQDLAGYDLEFLKLLLKSNINIKLVGDPRQTIYSTNDGSKYPKYRENGIHCFLKEEKDINNIITFNTEELKKSHRNSKKVCEYSSKLFPNLESSESCDCLGCKNKEGEIFLVQNKDIDDFIQKQHSVKILKYREADSCELNYGKSKGKTFCSVLIYPTETIKSWIKDHNYELSYKTRCGFYVALTRARNNVGIVFDYQGENFKEEDFTKFNDTNKQLKLL